LTSYLWYAVFITFDPLSNSVLLSSAYLFTSLGHTHSMTWGPYAAFHGMAIASHIESSMITAVWTHLRIFLNSKFYHFVFKCWILLKSVLGAWAESCTWKYRPWTGSWNRACNIFNLVVLDFLWGFLFCLFYSIYMY
jgi:hypothetical protein